MAAGYLIHNALIINEGRRYIGSLRVDGERIGAIWEGHDAQVGAPDNYLTIDGLGKWLIPGAIDDQVHFREPGLTHKADIQSESRAAVAGGVTSFMEMPNTVPATTSLELLEQKFSRAGEVSPANYSFYLGSTGDNLEEALKLDPKAVCGLKIFMGSSTGNLLVNNRGKLEEIFREIPYLIALHCEDDELIRGNLEDAIGKYGDSIPAQMHPIIRNAEACYRSTSLAIELATKYNTRIHILHISTARETKLFRNDIPRTQKRITAEACVHHLWFQDEDYLKLGNKIKWNPAVKSRTDRDAVREALRDGRIDVLATDHAPHTLEEKALPYRSCPSGGPLLQHALPAMFELCTKGIFSPEMVVDRYCHAPAELYSVKKRGYIRPGYFADLVLVDPANPGNVSDLPIYSKCGWSPFENEMFSTRIEKTFVNGHLAYDSGVFDDSVKGRRLEFER